MIKKTNANFFQTQLTKQNEMLFHGDDEPRYINDNITTLGELQVISDLSLELHNASYANKSKIAKINKILSKSQSLYIHNITENLDSAEKSKAAKSIADIIKYNPFLKSISLESNNFPKEDLEIIINAIVDAKINSVLKTNLKEVHLKKTITTSNAEEIIPKLVALKNTRDIHIDLDGAVNEQMNDYLTEQKRLLRKHI